MNANDYQKAAMRTAEHLTDEQLVENGILGMVGEFGEVVDLYKKHRYQGHKLDTDKVKEELGDCFWYLATLTQGFGLAMGDVLLANKEKLERRYPEGFSANRSINREA